MFHGIRVLVLLMVMSLVQGCGARPAPPGETDPGEATPSPDAGVEPVDGGVEPVDGGVGPVDGGVGPVDGGVGPVPEPGGKWWKPKPGLSWQLQLSGPLDTSINADVYDVDLFDTPEMAIAGLQAAGRKVICYFSAGSFEDWRPDRARFPAEVLGKPLDEWPGERWLDIRARVVREVVRERLDLAVRKGCDGVDPDNVDGYQNATGFALTAKDQLDFNRFLATEAHERGLAVGLKNDLDQIPQLKDDFDWVLSEECFLYGECHALIPFIKEGKPVLEVEYGGEDLASRVCPRALVLGLDTLVKNLELDATRIPCR